MYRKYSNSKAYFKVINEKCFEEIQLVGAKRFVTTIQAKQYPEMLRIVDMIACLDGIWIPIEEEEYEAQKKPS